MSLAPGVRIAAYEVVSLLGAGGMGEVYLARDAKLGRSVAVKVLPDAFAGDRDRVARFEREAKVLASLNHPHIAALFGMEESAGHHFLVMELVEGETLAERLARIRSPLPVDEALFIARQIAEALEAAHEKGVVHRDLKPANVKIAPDERVKVLDFGLAKAMATEAGHHDSAAGLTHSPTLTFAGATHAGTILGTAPYMSPEQAKGRTADKRSDVWAFGCVLYEMLAGRRAFEGDDVSETLASVLRAEPDWNALPSNLDAGIRALVQGCLRKDRKARVGDMSTALFLLNQPEAARAAAATERPAQPVWRLAMLVLAGVLIGAPAAILLWKPKPSAAFPVTRFALTLPERQDMSLARQVVAVSSDGTRIAYAADGRLFLRSMSEIEPRAIPGTESAVNPEFSPDGQSLVFWADSAVKRIAVGGGTPVTIYQVGVAPGGIEWNNDSILFGQPGAGIMRVSANGGKPETIVSLGLPEALAHGPHLLPDGSTLLFTLARRTSAAGVDPWDSAQIVVQSLKTGERKTVIESGTDGRYVPTGHIVYVQRGTLFAVPFDLAKLAVTAAAVPVVEGVRRVGVASVGTAHFAFSSTGSLVYVPGPRSSGQTDLFLFDRKGGAEALKLPPASYVNPRVSPDGKRLAVETMDGREANISIYDLSGTSSIRRLTFGGNNRFPIWSADGTRVAFQSDREGDRAIFWQSADGGTAERLTKPDADTTHVPESWSPAGDLFLFSAAKGFDVSLWTFSTRDRKAAAFGDVRSTLPTDAVFSPDGRWVAYQVGELNEGEGTTYVQPFPPSGARYQIARGGRPLWSRDGMELFYVPGPGRFMGVTVRTQPSFTFANPISVPRRWGIADPANPRPYDILPDGRIVGVGIAGQTESGAAAPSQIHVVLNWFEELKARVPGGTRN